MQIEEDLIIRSAGRSDQLILSGMYPCICKKAHNFYLVTASPAGPELGTAQPQLVI